MVVASRFRPLVNLLLAPLFVLWASSSAVLAQTGAISGKVTDAETGEALPSCNVIVHSADGAQAGGAATDRNGNYSVQGLTPGTYQVDIRFVGYETRKVAVNVSAGETAQHDVALAQTSIDFDAIVTTASRRPEKVLEAPASISVLDATEIRQAVAPSSVATLRNTTGVDMSQTGIDRYEVVMRGFNNAFSGAAYILTDYRKASVASLDVNIHSIMPNPSIDVHHIEVVRGPGSALYGAGVDNGVIHYLTKEPFTAPGTSVELLGGERSTFGAAWRTAHVVNENLGVKITGHYAQADDWELDPNDPSDAAQLETDVEGVVRDYSYEKYNINGMAQYRFSDNTSLTANGGFSALTGTVLSGIGTLRADEFGYAYGQLRLQAGDFFAQAYLNRNNTGDSFIYNSDMKPIDKSTRLTLQGQYSVELFKGREQLILGVDYDRTTPKTEGTINGRNEDNDLISEVGGYLHSVTALTDWLDVTADIRLDHNNIRSNSVKVSPRFAAVVKPTPGHTFRGSYNRAFSSPGTNSSFLDIVARKPDSDLPIQIRARGSAFGHEFERNSAYAAFANSDLVATSLNPDALGQPQPVGLPVGDIYASVYDELSQIPVSQLKQLIPQLANIPDFLVTQLVDLLSPENTQVEGFSQGQLGLLNLTTLGVDIIPDVTDIEPLDETTTETFELGYKGLIEDRFLFAVDGYYSQKTDFVSPLLMQTPFVLVPNLAQDLESALSTGINNNAVLAATLTAVGFDPAAVAELIVGLAAEQLPDASTPVAIVETTDNMQGPGAQPELMLAYRGFAGSIDYYGIDASFQFIASDRLNFFGNVSWVSDDFFDDEELDQPGTGLELALNASAFKVKGGFSYDVPRGISFNASARHIQGFPIRSGPFSGEIDDYFLLDVGAGYDLDQFAPGLRFDILVQNALDNKHREFVGAPQLGRMTIGRLNYSF